MPHTPPAPPRKPATITYKPLTPTGKTRVQQHINRLTTENR